MARHDRRRARRWRLLAVVLAVACSVLIAVLDAAVGHRAVDVLGLLATVPLVVAVFGGAGLAVVAGGVAGTTLLLMSDYDHALWHADVLVLLTGIAVATVVGFASALVRGHRVRRLHRIESVADVVQQTLLRPLPPVVGDVAVAAHYSSATRGANVGGDVYEVLSTPFGLRVFIGDVRGKGLPALHLANAVLGAFREWGYETAQLADVAAHLDASVARNAGPEDFVTAVIVEVGVDAIDIVNCAHPAPLLVANGAVTPVTPEMSSLPLGLGVTARAQRLSFGAGERLLLFTDGVSEARRRGRFFDVAAHIGESLDEDPRVTVEQLQERLKRFARRRLTDDIAIVLLERTGHAQVPGQPEAFTAYPDRLEPSDDPSRSHPARPLPHP